MVAGKGQVSKVLLSCNMVIKCVSIVFQPSSDCIGRGSPLTPIGFYWIPSSGMSLPIFKMPGCHHRELVF